MILVLLLTLAALGNAQVIVRTVCGPGGPIGQSTANTGGESVNSQTGTTYTYQNTDCGKLVTHSNGSAIAGTLPQANATTFRSGWFVDVENRGAGTLSITPTTSTIDGAASLALIPNRGLRIVSNGTNYFTERGGAGIAAGSVAVTSDVLKGDGAGNAVDAGFAASAAGIVSLFSTCSGTQYLGADGACHTASGSGGGLVLVEQHTANNTSTELDFTTCISSTYDTYQIEFVNVIPATNNVDLKMQASTDGGATYDTGSNYAYNRTIWIAGNGGTFVDNSTGTTGVFLSPSGANTSNASTDGMSGSLHLYSPGSSALDKWFSGNMVAFDSSSLFRMSVNFGTYKSTTAVNAFRLITSSGNLTSGTVRCYGLAK